jgi:hypothetical protein
MKSKHKHNGVAATRPPVQSLASPVQPPRPTPSPDGPSETLPPEQTPSPQKRPTLDMIRERAYFKWMESGCPASDGKEFWVQAEAEINGMSGEWSATNKKTPRD